MKLSVCLIVVTLCLCLTRSAWAQIPFSHLVDSPLPKEGDSRFRQYDLLTKQAQGAIKSGNTATAIALLKQALNVVDLEDSRVMLADIYIGQGKKEAALDTLRPLIYPLNNFKTTEPRDPRIRMKFVLLLLATKQWPEAVHVYEDTIIKPIRWLISNVPEQYELPIIHFSPDEVDYDGMQAQAHLILGVRQPMFVDCSVPSERAKGLQYMLDQLQQSLKLKPRSLHAQFVTGVLQEQLKQFGEARKAYLAAWDDATSENDLTEIKAALDGLTKKEEWKRYYESHRADKSKPTDQK